MARNDPTLNLFTRPAQTLSLYLAQRADAKPVRSAHRCTLSLALPHTALLVHWRAFGLVPGSGRSALFVTPPKLTVLHNYTRLFHQVPGLHACLSQSQSSGGLSPHVVGQPFLQRHASSADWSEELFFSFR